MVEKYIKKEIAIEAISFTRDKYDEILEFTNNKIHTLRIPKCMDGVATCIVDTLKGPMNATEGDYIIKGVDGEIYPCKQEEFERRYELI